MYVLKTPDDWDEEKFAMRDGIFGWCTSTSPSKAFIFISVDDALSVRNDEEGFDGYEIFEIKLIKV